MAVYDSWAREAQELVELAFNDAEDLTPSGFYTREDGERARDDAGTVVRLARPRVAGE